MRRIFGPVLPCAIRAAHLYKENVQQAQRRSYRWSSSIRSSPKPYMISQLAGKSLHIPSIVIIGGIVKAT